MFLQPTTYSVFLLIMVSFLTYLVILTPDKTLLTFWLSLTYLFHVMIKVKTQQDSWFYPGHCSLGEFPSGLAWCLPQIFACYLLLIITSFSLLQISHYD